MLGRVRTGSQGKGQAIDGSDCLAEDGPDRRAQDGPKSWAEDGPDR